MTDWGLIDPGGADATGTDDEAVLAALVDVERALLRAWGSVLDEFLGAQADALDPAALDRDALRAGVARDGVPVVALVPAFDPSAPGPSAVPALAFARSRSICRRSRSILPKSFFISACGSFLSWPSEGPIEGKGTWTSPGFFGSSAGFLGSSKRAGRNTTAARSASLRIVHRRCFIGSALSWVGLVGAWSLRSSVPSVIGSGTPAPRASRTQSPRDRTRTGTTQRRARPRKQHR